MVKQITILSMILATLFLLSGCAEEEVTDEELQEVINLTAVDESNKEANKQLAIDVECLKETHAVKDDQKNRLCFERLQKTCDTITTGAIFAGKARDLCDEGHAFRIPLDGCLLIPGLHCDLAKTKITENTVTVFVTNMLNENISAFTMATHECSEATMIETFQNEGQGKIILSNCIFSPDEWNKVTVRPDIHYTAADNTTMVHEIRIIRKKIT